MTRRLAAQKIPLALALVVTAAAPRPAAGEQMRTLREVLENLQANFVEPLDPERLFYNGVLGLRERLPWLEIYFPDDRSCVRLVHNERELVVRFDQLTSPRQVAPALERVLDLTGGGPGTSGAGGGEYTVIHGVLRGLGDPYTVFLTPAVYSKLATAGEPDMAEVGISLIQDDRGLYVGGVRYKSPAFRGGIKRGERLLAIDGQSTAMLAKMEGVAALWGKVGSPVALRIADAAMTERDVLLVRERGWAGEARCSRDDGDVLLLRISTFDRGIAAQASERLLAEMENGPVKGLILDVRANPGGFLAEGVALMERFLPRNTFLAKVGGAYEARTESYRTEGRRKQLLGQPMVVLVDGQSASVTELCSRALQVHRRALLVGEPTFGKGSVQTLFELSDGSALKMTVARYYAPDGHPIDRGIDPDLRVSEADDRDRPLEFARALLHQVHTPRVETLRSRGRALLRRWKQEAR